jgi:hypothetical protein
LNEKQDQHEVMRRTDVDSSQIESPRFGQVRSGVDQTDSVNSIPRWMSNQIQIEDAADNSENGDSGERASGWSAFRLFVKQLRE